MIRNIKKTSLWMAFVVFSVFVACNKDEVDETKPVISDKGITANPINCQVYHRGETIPFCYLFEDDTELGSYNIEVHDNSDHHSHSTEGNSHEGNECQEDHDHDHENGEVGLQHWVFNQSVTIPEGQRSYQARLDIVIPSNILTGDYHFMIRLTDKAGWQALKTVAIKIEK